jgi:hypothetical protein
LRRGLLSKLELTGLPLVRISGSHTIKEAQETNGIRLTGLQIASDLATMDKDSIVFLTTALGTASLALALTLTVVILAAIDILLNGVRSQINDGISITNTCKI